MHAASGLVLVELGFKVHRGLITERAVEPRAVVKDFDPFEDHVACFVAPASVSSRSFPSGHCRNSCLCGSCWGSSRPRSGAAGYRCWRTARRDPDDAPGRLAAARCFKAISKAASGKVVADASPKA